MIKYHVFYLSQSKHLHVCPTKKPISFTNELKKGLVEVWGNHCTSHDWCACYL